MKRFEGKVAVVTGAAQGVGFCTAKKFIEEGAKVVLTGRTESKLVKAAEQLGENASIFTMDVASEQSWKDLVGFLKEKYGEIDYLVNNAGVIFGKDILQITFEEFKTEHEIDLYGVFLGMKYCHEIIKKDVYSAIVNISSIAGLKAGPVTGNDAGYNSSKAGVRNLTKHAAVIFAPDKIRVNSVHPGGINTPMLKAYKAEHPEVVENAKNTSPLYPHCAEPEEVAETVLFLCDIKSKAITGAEIVIDAGTMAM